jgi:hypothetical protein
MPRHARYQCSRDLIWRIHGGDADSLSEAIRLWELRFLFRRVLALFTLKHQRSSEHVVAYPWTVHRIVTVPGAGIVARDTYECDRLRPRKLS